MKIKLKFFHFHLELARLANIIAIIVLVTVLGALIHLSLYSYNNWYKPISSNQVPEEKLQQKQEKLKLSEFQTVKNKLQEKKDNVSKIQIKNPLE
ncbi:MAG: light-harvesting protein [Patescibacteria group bacterium]|jgi:hypothetical protein